MNRDELKDFFERYHLHTTTETEHNRFINFLKTLPEDDINRLLDEYEGHAESNTTAVNEELVHRIELALDQIKKKDRKGRIVFIKWAAGIAAACILFLLVINSWYSPTTPTISRSSASLPVEAHDIAPGKQGAVLTLSDGRQLLLDELKDNSLAVQGVSRIVKEGNAVSYVASGKAGEELIYNTMSTPNGRTFSLTLADGSKVWLNAASSIRFPVAFSGPERKVMITGEAYFEVAKNSKKPFRVLADRTEVQVLGTHFNVNAYANEPEQRTTLLEGKIRIAVDGRTAVLMPGQQAIVGAKKEIDVLDHADIGEVMAWKEGYFSFNDNANLETVMRQLERWYDVEVIYEGSIPSMHFGGKISRDNNISEVLKILELSKVRFKVDKKKITVIP